MAHLANSWNKPARKTVNISITAKKEQERLENSRIRRLKSVKPTIVTSYSTSRIVPKDLGKMHRADYLPPWNDNVVIKKKTAASRFHSELNTLPKLRQHNNLRGRPFSSDDMEDMQEGAKIMSNVLRHSRNLGVSSKSCNSEGGSYSENDMVFYGDEDCSDGDEEIQEPGNDDALELLKTSGPSLEVEHLLSYKTPFNNPFDRKTNPLPFSVKKHIHEVDNSASNIELGYSTKPEKQINRPNNIKASPPLAKPHNTKTCKGGARNKPLAASLLKENTSKALISESNKIERRKEKEKEEIQRSVMQKKIQFRESFAPPVPPQTSLVALRGEKKKAEALLQELLNGNNKINQNQNEEQSEHNNTDEGHLGKNVLL
jgi:hypothetical protein